MGNECAPMHCAATLFSIFVYGVACICPVLEIKFSRKQCMFPYVMSFIKIFLRFKSLDHEIPTSSNPHVFPLRQSVSACCKLPTLLDWSTSSILHRLNQQESMALSFCIVLAKMLTKFVRLREHFHSTPFLLFWMPDIIGTTNFLCWVLRFLIKMKVRLH